MGYLSMQALTTASNNTCVGTECLQGLTTGTSNLGFGYRAGYGITTGTSNTIGGSDAINISATTATGNSVWGYHNLSACTDCQYNSILGTENLEQTTTGIYNVAMSRGALGLGDGNYNVAIGLNAGRGVAGSRRVGNVLLGVESGEAITAAINNIYLGYRAGEGMTDGNNNIILAYDRDLLTTSSSNMLDIGGIIFG